MFRFVDWREKKLSPFFYSCSFCHNESATVGKEKIWSSYNPKNAIRDINHSESSIMLWRYWEIGSICRDDDKWLINKLILTVCQLVKSLSEFLR